MGTRDEGGVLGAVRSGGEDGDGVVKGDAGKGEGEITKEAWTVEVWDWDQWLGLEVDSFQMMT